MRVHYAESTMNELLSIFGYEDKIDSTDTDKLDLKKYTHPSDLDGNDVAYGDVVSDDEESVEEAGTRGKLRLRLRHPLPNGTTDIELQHRNLLSVLKKKENSKSSDDLSVSDTAEEPEEPCVWCRKSGHHQYIVKTSNGEKTFCSEVCFIQCRRASFKKSKICDWCKHVRHTVNYVEFRDGESQLQFCSEKCLNQYKMSIFCKETQEHLNKIKEHADDSESDKEKEKEILITPDLWQIGELTKLRGAKTNSPETPSAKSDSYKKTLTNNIEKSVKKVSDSKYNNELQKQSLIERIKAEANVKHRKLSRKDSDRQPAATATEPATSPRPGSLAQVSPQMYHPGLAGMAPWIHQAQLLGSMGQSFGPYGAYSSVMFPGLMPPYPPEVIADMAAAAAEREKEHTGTREKRIKTEPGSTGAQHSPHSDRPSTGNAARRSFLEVPNMESARRSASPNRNSHNGNRHSSSLFPVDFPQFFSGQPFNGAPSAVFQGQQPPPRMIGNGIPPVTMMIPFPVLLPLPVPIPIPIPLTMDTLMKHFQPNNRNTSGIKHHSPSTSDKENRDFLRESRSPRPSTHSPLSVSSGEDIRHSNYGNEGRSGSRSSCPDLSSSYHYIAPSLSDVSSLKRSRTPDETGSLDLSKRSKLPKFDPLSYEQTDGVIDLSSKYHGRSSVENRSENASSHGEMNDSDDKNSRDSNDNLTEGSDLVPKIHIVTHAETRPLNQHLPLPPTEHRYANRRGLILDAPSLPKKKRSPSPERPNYVRNIPRDLLEAARRRSLRARIRTK